MATKKTAKRPATEVVNVRLPTEVVDRLDVWLTDLNAKRRVPLSRSDLIRGVLDHAAEKRPDWERK